MLDLEDLHSSVIFAMRQGEGESLGGRIDLLESFACLVMFSCATDEEKIQMLLEMYSFEDDAALTFDELYLCAQSTLSGLQRVCSRMEGFDLQMRQDFAIEDLVDAIIVDAKSVSIAQVQRYLLQTDIQGMSRWFFVKLKLLYPRFASYAYIYKTPCLYLHMLSSPHLFLQYSGAFLP